MASKQKFIARANPKNLGPQLMLLIRDKKTDTWKKICAETGLPFNEFHTAHSSYWGALNSLKEAGLVTFERDLDDTKYGYTDIGKIKISKNWHLTQQALDVSLSRLSGLDPNEITVKPPFGPPSSCIDAFDVFVMMPFDGELDPIYEDHLKKVCENQELSIGRGDDAFTTEAVMLDIWSQIHLAKIAIADCTGRNPNVFYELGLAVSAKESGYRAF